MSAAQHTPGPWMRDRESGFECDVRASNGRRIAAVNVQNPPKTKQQFDGRKAENEANARLIAAAPEHHAVAMEFDRLCLVIESAIRHFDPKNHAAVMALILSNRAAIAKATESQTP